MNDNNETKKYFSILFDEFSNFIFKKNAIDMALGIIIGLAFSKIVSSLVSDIIMPPLGLILTGMNFQDLKLILKNPIINVEGKIMQAAVTINYGKFLQSLLDFAIISFSAFLIVKLINKLTKQREKMKLDWTEYLKK